MKIGDIKVGEEYGAVENPTRNYGTLPRRVVVQEIVTEEQGIWTGGGYGARSKRNVRRLKVKFLDEVTASRRYRDDIAGAEKDSVKVIEARFLVAPWAELRRDVQKRIDHAQREAEALAEVERRIKAVLPKHMRGEWFYASSNTMHNGKVRVEVKLEGRVLDTMLALAEKGAAAS